MSITKLPFPTEDQPRTAELHPTQQSGQHPEPTSTTKSTSSKISTTKAGNTPRLPLRMVKPATQRLAKCPFLVVRLELAY